MTASRALTVALLLIVVIFLVGCGTTAEAASSQASKNNSTVAVTTTSLPTATVMTTYSAQVTASGGVPPYKWSLAPNTKLPAGVSFDASNGSFSGMPNQQGSFQVGVQVTDSLAKNGSNKNLTLQVTPPLTVGGGALGAATVGSAYSTTLTASGGSSPDSWQITSGALPAGLKLASNGTISGTPTTAANSSFTVLATDSASPAHTASGTYSLSVSGSTVQIVTSSLPSGQAGSAYQTSLSATGGAAPYTWGLTSGSLPTGVKLDVNTGIISGTPTLAGTYAVTLSATDTMGRSTTKQFSLVIAAAAALALQISSSALPSGLVGTPYSAVLAATGGTGPYTWSIASGSLPGSLALSATSGSIDGTPSSSGTFNFNVKVTDANSATATAPLSLAVSASGTLDQYGGLMTRSCASATGWFHVEKVSNKWWFCTPEGHELWMIGVMNISGADGHVTDLGMKFEDILNAKYGDNSVTYGPQVVRRMKSWGFNSVGEFSYGYVKPTWTSNAWPGDHTQPVKVPAIAEINPSKYSIFNNNNYLSEAVKDVQRGINTHYYPGWASSFPDLWDSNFGTYIDQDFANDPNLTAEANSPWTLAWTTDEGDNLYGLVGSVQASGLPTSPDGYYQRQQALMTLMMSPVQNANDAVSGVYYKQTYQTSEVHTKTAFISWLKTRYNGSIDALNSAWGSSYSGFDSAGTQVTGETFASPDGVRTGFSKTLAHSSVSPYSVVVKVGGKRVGGDCPEWAGGSQCQWNVAGHGGFTGAPASGISGGDIVYANGTATINFSTPPPSGSTITVDYIYGGWSYGNTVADEDGRHTWVVNTNKVTLAGATQAFTADMNAFLVEISKQYFSTVITKVRAHAPKQLVAGPGVMGTWGGVPSQYVLQGAAAANLDLAATTLALSNSNARLDYWAQNFGDKPLILWHGTHADADSPFWRYDGGAATGCTNCYTQADRAKWYADAMNTFLNSTNTTYGSRTIIGFRWWGWVDQWNETTWGLVDLQDNAYNGVENCNVSKADAWGFKTFPEETLPTWAASTSYVQMGTTAPVYLKAGSRVQVVAADGNRYIFQAISTGTSGSSAPVWPTAKLSKVVDGGVTWLNVGQKAAAGCYGDFLSGVTAANQIWRQ